MYPTLSKFLTLNFALLLALFTLLSSVVALPTKVRPSHSAKITCASDIPHAEAASPSAYIIALNDNTVNPQARAQWLASVLSNGTHTKRSFDSSDYQTGWSETIFNGLAGQFSTDDLTILSARPEVKWIQQDILLHTATTTQQGNAPWGLSRLSNGNSSLPAGSNPGNLNFTYTFDNSGGSGVDIYFLDTGVRSSHQDFGGRADFLQTFGNGTNGEDVNGHGTHVSGTAAGSEFGVAKQASINMIKCTADDGSGTTTDIISAINLAANKTVASGRPSVVSMSLSGPANQAIDDAVSNAVTLGVPFVIAAGNDGADASNSSPARLGGPNGNPGIITVGATTITDEIASFSNFGANVDIFAPGQDVLSDGIASDTAVLNDSGTSMSVPHIAGLAALIMGQSGKLSPEDLKQQIVSLALSGVISGLNSTTVNKLGSNGDTN